VSAFLKKLVRFDMALGLGTVLYLVMLEGHFVRRPWVFLVGPFVCWCASIFSAQPFPREDGETLWFSQL
jgi:hypothetical protein